MIFCWSFCPKLLITSYSIRRFVRETACESIPPMHISWATNGQASTEAATITDTGDTRNARTVCDN